MHLTRQEIRKGCHFFGPPCTDQMPLRRSSNISRLQL